MLLASYTLNNTRLLLLSGIGRPYDPGTGQVVVGRNYSYQTMGKIPLFFNDREFNRFMGGGASGTIIDEFNGDNFDHAGLGFIGGAYVSMNTSGNLPIKFHPVPPGTPRWGSAWKKAGAQNFNRSLMMSVHGGCQSFRSNYLDLDPTYRDVYSLPLLRMTFDFKDNDRKMQTYVTNKALEICKAMKPAQISASPTIGKFSIVPYQCTHNNGGAIAGSDPATSTVHKYLQCWDAPNVFVVGTSAFPRNSANNPTGTVGALACWVVDAIKDQYLKRSSAMV